MSHIFQNSLCPATRNMGKDQSKEVVENIRQQLNESFRDIYQGIEINK